MIETPPTYNKNDDTIPLMVSLQDNGELKNIQDNYYYWDKIKYKAKDCKPEELWNAVNYFVILRSNTVKFNTHSFSYMITDYMQRALHQFDLHIGGTLGAT